MALSSLDGIIDCRVCDGCSYELTITYADNRKKKMHGDLGGGTVDKTYHRDESKNRRMWDGR